MKRYISALVAAALIIVLLPASAFAVLPTPYWNAYANYQAAVESGDLTRITNAMHGIENAIPHPSDEQQYNALAWRCQEMAERYEKQRMFSDAVEYYEKFLKYVTWLHNNTSADYSDWLKLLPAIIEHDSQTTEIYAVSNNAPKYYGTVNEPVSGTCYGAFEGTPDCTAALIYVSFLDETIPSFDWKFNQVSDSQYCEIAWNIPDETKEELEQINSGECDGYIRENLEYVATLNCKVLLRFGAEVNCWQILDGMNARQLAEFADIYRRAFIRVSNAVRRYAPNAAVVYSPNDLSNWNVSAADFYPGDEYVDWIGLSSYYRESGNAENTLASYQDAFYCRGMYKNSMVRIRDVVENISTNKPIMISECGFCYESDKNSLHSPEKAAKELTEFYAYVNMIYPQVKAVLYFNRAIFGESFGYSDNSVMSDAYQKAVSANDVMQSSFGTQTKSYVKLSDLYEKTDSLRISTYYGLPTDGNISVSYTLDGAPLDSLDRAPYTAEISSTLLTEGSHRLVVTVNDGNNITTVERGIYKGENGLVSCGISAMTDVPETYWGYQYIEKCMQEGLFRGVSATTFEPKTSMTRAMFVQVLANLSGNDLSAFTAGRFTDVPAGKWFTRAIAWAAENNIVNGMTADKFEPNTPVSREQMCVMMVRYAEWASISLDAPSTGTFADDASIAKYASSAVYICKNAGLVTGMGGNMFAPKNKALRAEVAAILSRYYVFVVNN